MRRLVLLPIFNSVLAPLEMWHLVLLTELLSHLFVRQDGPSPFLQANLLIFSLFLFFFLLLVLFGPLSLPSNDPLGVFRQFVVEGICSQNRETLIAHSFDYVRELIELRGFGPRDQLRQLFKIIYNLFCQDTPVLALNEVLEVRVSRSVSLGIGANLEN